MMATQVIRRNIVGSAQTIPGGSSLTEVLADWTPDNGWNATVELTIVGVGASSGSVNSYYRRQVCKYQCATVVPVVIGALVADTTLEEDAAWDAHIETSGTGIVVNTVGDAVEVVNWSWTGTVTLEKAGWGSSYPMIKDYSKSGFNGTMTNMDGGDIVVDSPGAGSVHSTDFDGANDWVAMGNVLQFDRETPCSFSFWCKIVAAGGTVIAKWRDTPAPLGYLLSVTPASISFGMVRVWPTNGFWISAGAALGTGIWKHVVVTFSGNHHASGVTFYLNADPCAPGAPTFDTSTTTIVSVVELRFGRSSQAVETPFDGRLNNISIYNKELSQAEVTEIYAGGTCPDLKALSTAANLVGWWKMGD